jgi:hypothetical protein
MSWQRVRRSLHQSTKADDLDTHSHVVWKLPIEYIDCKELNVFIVESILIKLEGKLTCRLHIKQPKECNKISCWAVRIHHLVSD